jgi:hypothetical protein
MSKPELMGLVVLACGSGFGFVWGGAFGLALAAVCLVVGLVLFVALRASGTETRSTPAQGLSQPRTQILVLVKEVHARPQRAGKFQEIRDPHQTDLQFEIFTHCWLVNDTDERLRVITLQVSLTKPDGTTSLLERVPSNLQNWRMGRLRDELDSWGVRYLQAAQESLVELGTAEPLERGATRQGWLHLRVENITPAEMKNATIELEVIDSHLRSHIGAAKGPHQIPGRVWPFRVEDGKAPDAYPRDLASDTRGRSPT